MTQARLFTAEDGNTYLAFDLQAEDLVEATHFSDFLRGNGVWSLGEGLAVFYPFSEHPNVVRGYN